MAGAAGHSHRVRRLSGHKKPKIDSVRPDINVTPLVDVMLVLLIIFMLMTFVMGRGADVQVPAARYYSQEKDKNQPVVTIDKDGVLFVEKDKLGPVSEATLKEMENRVRTAWKARTDNETRIYFKADSMTPYSTVYPALEYMNKTMELSSVDLATSKQEDK